MNTKKWTCLVAALAMVATLSGCGNNGNAVYVQSVKELGGFGGIAPGDRFPGMVVSENVTEIDKDNNKTIAEVLVKEGQDVTAGQPLFSYDMDQLQLTLDKQRLEKEQLEATIENYKRQIEDLQKAEKKATGNSKLQYTIQIQSTQIDLKEATPLSPLPLPAVLPPSMKTVPTTMATPCPTLPFSRQDLSGLRVHWASCSGAALWKAAA